MVNSLSNKEQLFAAPIDEVPLAFIDLEMTGLDPAADHVIEICIERVRAGVVVAALTSLVRPSARCVVDGGVHGLREQDLATAPTFAQLTMRISSLLRGAVVVAHAVKHDIAFLQTEYQRAGQPFSPPVYVDTLAIARRTLERPAYGLAALAQHFDIENPKPHRAANDVSVTRALFAQLR
ncbi:MAG TPA: 3'-5' exonuclease, partial [Sorangium sp.]|nr:3'-5' exonuclease [Sorangium sp.]